ncbi:uncharacterized protein K02A2.6-like [Uranotaenia lowii]|uniref:uncharacterized protein K02A2.6-like n=1 Tax=Uranotaenia lowii TaxID=190385 RepID=UPI00247AF9B1|nr:uncharacterized protein K02A2.6-like [Uranotaenia lowii]
MRTSFQNCREARCSASSTCLTPIFRSRSTTIRSGCCDKHTPFQFNRLPLGVKSTPGAFQQLMSKIIAGLEGVDSFLDDFTIYSASREQHDRILEELFQDYGFHLRRKSDVSELRSFLGAANFYGKFVREIHRIRQPLDDLLKKDKKFVWSAQCYEAFETIKNVMQSDLLLTHYNPSLELIAAGDPSKTGVDAVITHLFPDGQLKAIAHASKSLTSTEQIYSQVEKEALALVFAVTKFRIHTAYRLQWWALSLLGFDFNVEYISTDKLGYADVLSRLISNHQKPEEEYVVASISLEEDVNESLEDCFTSLPVNFKMFIDNGWPRKIEDPKLKAFHSRRESLSVVNGCIMMEDHVVVAEFYSQRILRQLHWGHQGMERMKAIARSGVYWPNIDNDIQDLVRRCDICASAAKFPPHFQPQPRPRTDGPWKRIHLDYAGPLEAATIRFLLETFARFGIPETLITDSGTQFCSSEFKKMCEQLGIIHIRTAPYHPQSNGQAERFVDTLKRSLRKIGEGVEVPSAEALQTFLQVCRSTPSATLAG